MLSCAPRAVPLVGSVPLLLGMISKAGRDPSGGRQGQRWLSISKGLSQVLGLVFAASLGGLGLLCPIAVSIAHSVLRVHPPTPVSPPSPQ